MAHGPSHLTEQDTRTPGGGAFGVWIAGVVLGVIGLGVGTLLALVLDDGIERFAFGYLIAFAFWLALVLGCLFFVLVTHLFRAGWCVMVRRVAENGAAAMPVLALLSLPILFFVGTGDGTLYAWADDKWEKKYAHAHGETHDEEHKDAGPEEHGHEEPGHHEDGHADEGHDGHAAADGLYYVAADTGTEVPEPHGDDAHDASHSPNLTAEYHAAPNEAMVGHFLFDYDGHRTGKGLWLQPWFFTLRWIIYVAVWCGIAWYYRKLSIEQDKTKDPTLTNRREAAAPASMIAFALTLTFAAFDLIMSLDPTWYSTIFGVYYFANAFTGGLCVIILTHMLLQRKGLVPTVSVEHYHDLGKLLFAFVFFWGYIAYSQYILIWYPSMPEIAYWFQLRGVTTEPSVPQYGSGWMWLALILLFGHLLIPFAFLLSKHVKRNRACLAGACVWLLLMIAIDLFWLVRPVLSSGIGAPEPELAGVAFGVGELVMQIALWLGIGGIVLAAGVRMARDNALVAHGDPRLHESLKLDTSAAAPLYDH